MPTAGNAEDIGLVEHHMGVGSELRKQSDTHAHYTVVASAVIGDHLVSLRVLSLFLCVLCVPRSRV
jgi:hypothetical protein